MRADIPRQTVAFDRIRIIRQGERPLTARDSLRIAYARFLNSAAVRDLVSQTGPWRKPISE